MKLYIIKNLKKKLKRSYLIFNLKFCRRREESDWNPILSLSSIFPLRKFEFKFQLVHGFIYIRSFNGPFSFQRLSLPSNCPFASPTLFQGSNFKKTTFSQENFIASFFLSPRISLTQTFSRLLLLQVCFQILIHHILKFFDLSFNFLIILRNPLG